MFDSFDFPDIAESFDLESLDGFTLSDDKSVKTRYCQPKIVMPEPVMYERAVDMALKVPIKKSMSLYALVSGNFIFGDYLEALVYERGLDVEEMHIATLSMSENNVDSLKNILLSGKCKKLNLIVSHYFYSHERNRLIPYIYSELDHNNMFQLAVAGSHCKIALIRTADDMKLTLHGSANLRSSSNIEQMMLNEDERLYAFNRRYLDEIIKAHKTIDKRKSLRGDKLWQQVAANSKTTTN